MGGLSHHALDRFLVTNPLGRQIVSGNGEAMETICRPAA